MCERAPQVVFKSRTPKRRRVLQDRFQRGATPLCFSTSKSTSVLIKNQEVWRDSVRSNKPLLTQPALKYQFMASHQQEYAVTVMCCALEVSVSGFYAWRKRQPSQRSREDAELAGKIKRIKPHVPVVIYSGAPIPTMQNVDCFIQKGEPVERFLSIINDLVKRFHQSSAAAGKRM